MSDEQAYVRPDLGPDLTFALDFPSDGEQPQVFTLQIPALVVWSILESIIILGPTKATQLTQLGMAIVQSIQGTHVEPSMEFTWARVFIESVSEQLLGEEWTTPEDRVLAFTHRALHTNQMKWDEAADVATRALGKEISPGALRKRLERWAPEHGLPKIEKYRPRQPK